MENTALKHINTKEKTMENPMIRRAGETPKDLIWFLGHVSATVIQPPSTLQHSE